MLDIRFIRDHKDIVVEGARKKHIPLDIDGLIALDDRRRALLQSIEKKRTLQNSYNDKITKAANGEERVHLVSDMQSLKTELKKEEEAYKDVFHAWQAAMMKVPNVPDVSVPEGKDESENVEIKTWNPNGEGEVTTFNFEAKDHITLMEQHDMADFARGTKVSGFRGYFLKNAGAQLEFAVWNYFLDALIKKGFTPMIVPSLVNKQTLYGTGYLPQGEDDLYKTQDADYLAGTGEVATMAYHSDETFAAKDLPKKYVAFSPCFRREAGSHSKDVKGLIRVHEFFKLEQVVLCEASHEQSVALHEEITANVEELLKALKLPYRTLLICGGDLGLGQVKKYDLEVWMPSQKKYRETHSASYFHDFQSRRLNIKYKDTEGKSQYVHSLNNTLVATPRMIACIVENYQQPDGSIKIPDVLVPYMGGRTSIGAPTQPSMGA